MRLHPTHGQTILKNIQFLEGAGRIVAQHHEKWDGTGYPNGLRGEAIDIGARIFAVIDAFDAIVSDRVYRDAQPYESALKEIEKYSGTQFDPLIVTAFRGVPKEDWEILREPLANGKTGRPIAAIDRGGSGLLGAAVRDGPLNDASIFGGFIDRAGTGRAMRLNRVDRFVTPPRPSQASQ